MSDHPSLIAANQRRWVAMHFRTPRLSEFHDASKIILAPSAKAQYQDISKATGVPWGVVGVIHYRESTCNFGRQLAQGDPLTSVSTHEPKGQGPYHDRDGHSAFYWSALVALDETGATKWGDWSPGGALTFLEKYNGLGYASHGVPSPYIRSGSDQYTVGKIEVDHGPINPVVDKQLGCAPLLRYMSGLDPSVGYGPSGAPVPVPIPPLPDHPPPLDIPPVPVPVPTPTPPPVPTPVPTPVPVPVPTPVPDMPALLMMIMNNPALMGILTSVISNPQLVQTITQILTGLSSQVSSGVTPATAVQNLILTQFDLEAAADAVKAEVAKLGLTPWTRDQEREMAAVVIRSYISNVKAGK